MRGPVRVSLLASEPPAVVGCVLVRYTATNGDSCAKRGDEGRLADTVAICGLTMPEVMVRNAEIGADGLLDTSAIHLKAGHVMQQWVHCAVISSATTQQSRAYCNQLC